MYLIDTMGVSLSARDHLKIETSLAGVRDDLSTLPTADIVQTAAKMLYFMEATSSPGIADLQTSFLNLVPAEHQPVVGAFLSEQTNNVVFHPQQLYALIRMGLASGQPEAPRSFANEGDSLAFFRAACGVTDLIADYSAFPVPTGLAGTSSLPARPLAIFFIRSAVLSRRTFFKARSGRAYLMWFDCRIPWPETALDPDGFCDRAFGCSHRRFTSIALAPALARVNYTPETSPDAAVFDPTSYYKNTNVSRSESETILDSLGFVPDDPGVFETPAPYWDFRAFAQRPFVPAGSGLLMPAGAGNAVTAATTGIFWSMHSVLSEAGEVHQLTDHYGRIFEDYAVRLFESIESDGRLVSGEIKYGTKAANKRSSDVLVVEYSDNPVRVFVETSTIRPRSELFTDGSVDALDAYVERIVDKLKQLNSVINDHIDQRFEIHGDALETAGAYVPLCVIDEPFFWTPSLWSLLQDQILQASLFSPQNVTRPIVCDINDLERIIDVVEGGASLRDVLIGYMLEADYRVPIEQYLDKHYSLDTPSIVSDAMLKLGELAIEEIELEDPAS